MINRRIVIVRSSERGLSSLSEVSARAIFSLLSRHYSQVEIKDVNDYSDLKKLINMSPDLVFLGMQFIPENRVLGKNDNSKIWLSEELSKNNIAHTGSNHHAQELEMFKHFAKQKVLSTGLKTSPYILVNKEEPKVLRIKLNYPLFIKPANRGGGVGIDDKSVVYNLEDLNSRIQYISDEYQSDSLVEEYLPGREFSVAILKNVFNDSYIAMPLELISKPNYRGISMLSSQVKSSNSERAVEVVDLKLKNRVCELAINAFHALGSRDYGRIDIRLDKNGEPNFLEANLIPSLISGYGSFPKACVINQNMHYEAMILSIVELGMRRSTSSLSTELKLGLPVATSLSAKSTVV